MKKKKLKLIPVSSDNFTEAVAVVEEIFFYEVPPSGRSLPHIEYEISARLFKDGSNQKSFLVYVGRQIIGVTGYKLNYTHLNDNEVWLNWFGIRAHFRGKGYGKAVLELTLDLIKKVFGNKLSVIKLDTSNRTEQLLAHKLYQSFGFVKYGHRNTKPYQTYYFKKVVKRKKV